jgi:hypothetical protein
VGRWVEWRTDEKQQRNFLRCGNIMEQFETANDWPSEDASDSQNSGSSSSDSDESQPAPRSQLRPAGLPSRSYHMLTGTQNGHTKANERYTGTCNGRYA